MMQPAKSCYTCYHAGSLTRGPECRFAATELCCEDWIAPKSIKVRVTMEVEIDLTRLEFLYGEEINTLEDITPVPEDYFNDILRITESGFEITDICKVEEVDEDRERDRWLDDARDYAQGGIPA